MTLQVDADNVAHRESPQSVAHEQSARRIAGEEGLWVLLLGDMLIFALFFGTLVVTRADQPDVFHAGQQTLHPWLGITNTLLLLTGSILVVHGVRAVRNANGRAAGLFGGALACGLGFAGIKAVEYSLLIRQGHAAGSNDFYMYYFIFTGIHLAHLTIGLVITMDTLLRFVRGRQMLVVLDNCEHLLDACAELVVALLGGAPRLTMLATSREPIGVSGEGTWRVPSLSLTAEAIELFADRARLAQPDFAVIDDNADAVAEICRRLDGIPLAIELAAARVRALSLAEIVEGLHDRFRLLTGGSRTAVRRQQTLRASVDWSHALLTETERILFRRLAVFLGGFALEAAQAVAGSAQVERYQVLDQLTLLVDKSLVVEFRGYFLVRLQA